MSTPKAALNRRIKISNTGRPYVDVADLVRTKLNRIKKSHEQGLAVGRDVHDNPERNNNDSAANNNSNVKNAR